MHRDIKPGNVLLRKDATFVCDFGIGFAFEGTSHTPLTDPGRAIGSPSYMSPEQVSGDARVEVELVKLGWGQENPAHRQVFSSLFFPEADPKRIAWFNELQRVTASPENAARIMEAAFDIDVTAEARALRVPTLVFHCQNEERVPVAAGRYLASLIPGAEFVALPSRNHIPLEHEPAWAQFLSAFDAFTKRS